MERGLSMPTLSVLLPCKSEKNINAFIEEIERLNVADQIVVYNDSQGKGKGNALREALKQCSGDQVAFLDGDGDISPRMLLRLLPFIEDFDAVVGSKRITYSPLRRKIMTHLTRIWFRFLFGVQVDTQTGIKLFRRGALDSVKNWESNGFIFDVEILEQLQRNRFKLVEVPIECEIKRQLAFKTIFRIFIESLWLKFRLLSQRRK